MTKARAPRELLGRWLADAADEDDRVIVLDADLGRSTRLDEFEARHPGQLIQLGVAEQNAAGVASGLAYAGLRPVFVSMAMFAAGLPWTQLRMAAYAGLDLLVIGSHPGLDIGPDGGTHQMLEDLALMRVIPEFRVLCPSDTGETAQALAWALNASGPTYLRLGRHPVPDLAHATPYRPGEAEIVCAQPSPLVLVAEGSMVAVAVAVARALPQPGASVVDIRSVKPLDDVLLRRLAADASLVVVLENHSVVGGVGSAVLECLDGICPVERIGTPDTFGSSACADELRRHFRLDEDSVLDRLRELAGS